MHDIAGVSIIVTTVLATAYWRKRTLDHFRTEMLGHFQGLRLDMSKEIESFRSSVIGKLDSIQKEMRDLRISYLAQQKK